MTTKNKFAYPPYLPEFKKEDAQRLRKILHIISRTCCEHKSAEGAIRDIDDLLERPSKIRECDLYVLRPVVDAINMVAGTEEYDPDYMLRQIERLTWEGHVLRRALITSGADMDKIDTGNEAWMARKKEAS